MTDGTEEKSVIKKAQDNFVSIQEERLQQDRDAAPFEGREIRPNTRLAAFSDHDVETNFVPPEEPVKEDAPFESALIQSMLRHSTIFQAVNRASRQSEEYGMQNYQDTEVPDNWTANEVGSLDDINELYWSYVLTSTSPSQLAARRESAKDSHQIDQIIESGGWFTNFIGAGIGYGLSPETWIFPMLAVAKSVKAGKHIIQGAAKVLPSIAAQSLAHETIIATERADLRGKFAADEVILNTLMDTAFGGLLYGAGRGVTFASNTRSVWASRKIASEVSEGVGIIQEMNEHGDLITKAYATEPGVGQALVDIAQAKIDSQLVSNAFSSIIEATLAIPIIGSPLVMMMRSSYHTVREFGAKVGNDIIITKGIERGEPRPITLVEMLRDFAAKARQIQFETHALFLEHNGFSDTLKGNAEDFVAKYKTGEYLTREEFNLEVRRVIRDGAPSDSKQINKAATLQEDNFKRVWTDFLESHDMPTDILPSKTAVGYMMRHYNREEMLKNPDGFINDVADALQIQDNQIKQHILPIEALKEKVSQLNKELVLPRSLGTRTAKKINIEIKSKNAELKALEKQLANDMRDGIVDPALIDQTIWLNTTETEQLRQLLKPLEKINAKIDSAKADIEFADRAAGRRTKSKESILTDEELIKLAKIKRKQALGRDLSIDEKTLLNKERKQPKTEAEKKKREEGQTLEDKLENLIKERDAIKESLQKQARDGDINRKFFVKGKDGVEFRDTSFVPKFRSLYRDYSDMKQAAGGYYDTIMGQTADQTSMAILSRLSGASGENPSKGRTLLVQDTVFDNGKFLSSDIDMITMTYSRTLGKKIALKRAYADMDLQDGIGTISENLTIEFNDKKNVVISSMKKSKKRDKALLKLNKEFENQKVLLQGAYDAFMGNNKSSGIGARAAKTARTAASIGMLRNVPMLQIAELFAIGLKQNMWNLIKGGLIPLVKSMNEFRSKDSFYQQNAWHSLVAIQTEIGRYGDALMDVGGKYTETGNFIPTKFEKFIDSMGKVSQNVFLTNYFNNVLHRISASTTQSRVMALAFKHADGKTLTKGERLNLSVNGLTTKDLNLFIKQYNGAGGYKDGLAYVSNWYLWEDVGISNKMKRAINNDITGSILEPNALDRPFAASTNPLASVMFQFLGYLYAASNRFTLPMAQRLETQQFMGMFMMVAMSTMVEPMRAWAKGEEYDLSEQSIEKIILNAISESGVLGFPAHMVESILALIEVPYLSSLGSEKFRRRSLLGVVGGPAASYMDSWAKIISMTLNGEFNQKDLKRLSGVSPLPIPLYIDIFLKRIISGTDLPETRGQARR